MSCDLTNGRLLDACSLGRAGIKTLYFTKFNDFDSLTGIVESGGEITSLGADPITIYQFDMADNVGMFDEALTTAKDNGTSFVTQVITLTLLQIKPADLENLNNLKRGRWTIWALDFQGKIRLFGRLRGCLASGGSDVSGVAPGDKKGLDLQLTAVENAYAPFMDDYTDVPFDNFANVTVVTDEFGPELHTNSNAAADPNGTEADAITGFSENDLSTGSNEFESQSSVKNVGTYAILANANPTPTGNAGFFVDLEAAPFNCVNGKTYQMTFDIRHQGTGGTWNTYLASADNGTTNLIVSKTNLSVTFEAQLYEWVHDTNHRYFVSREFSPTNNGGCYFDNLSVREVF